MIMLAPLKVGDDQYPLQFRGSLASFSNRRAVSSFFSDVDVCGRCEAARRLLAEENQFSS